MSSMDSDFINSDLFQKIKGFWGFGVLGFWGFGEIGRAHV